MILGELLGVVSINALEPGIEIGHLDGYPGSAASFWQQAGCAGRRERAALTILVLRQDALDQYFSLHPEKLLERPAEVTLVNISNPYILPRHLLGAVYEQPLPRDQLPLFGPHAEQAIATLVERYGNVAGSTSLQETAEGIPPSGSLAICDGNVRY